MLKFTIITVCYNAEKSIKKTIESVLTQTYSDIEFLIMDGLSTDHTLDIINEYSEDKRLAVFSNEDSGIYNAMNRGIAKMTGDYVCFLNAGDIFYDNNVVNKISQYLTDNKWDIIIGNYIEKKHEISRIVKMNATINWKEILENGNGICHQAIFASIDCLSNGFNEKYKFAADFNWLCEQVNLGYDIQWVDVVISEFDAYGVSSLAKNWIKVKTECRKIVEENFPYKKGKIESQIDLQYRAAKNQKILECLNDILALKQKNKSIIDFFRENSIRQIGIYGFQYLGQRLLGELESSEIIIRYIIDRNHLFQNVGVPLKFIDDELEPVDAIIVTPIFEFDSISFALKNKIKTKIVSIEDIINSMY